MQDKGTLLYRRFLSGDEEGLEELISLYKRGLLRFIYGYVQDIGLAEDVLTDVFMTLYYKRSFKEQDDASLKTYLYTIARNKSLNLLKKQKRRKEVSLEALSEKGTLADEKQAQEYFYAKLPSPDLALELSERNETLYRALKNIPTAYREALILRYFDDIPPERIAKIVKRSKKQVYNLLARGKTALKKQLLMEGIYHENV